MSNANHPSPHLPNPDAEARREAFEVARLQHAHRAFWIAVGLVTIAALLAAWQSVGAWRSDARDAKLIAGVDPNTAGWAELALLPGLGESVAKRIVAYREARRGQLAAGVPVFQKPADLLPVNGIGERMLKKIEGSLRFPNGPSSEFDSPTDGG